MCMRAHDALMRVHTHNLVLRFAVLFAACFCVTNGPFLGILSNQGCASPGGRLASTRVTLRARWTRVGELFPDTRPRTR
eukprot:9399789-Pyramimonas_sp.AAC.1